jgi:hypothetical protein
MPGAARSISIAVGASAANSQNITVNGRARPAAHKILCSYFTLVATGCSSESAMQNAADAFADIGGANLADRLPRPALPYGCGCGDGFVSGDWGRFRRSAMN